MQNPDPDTPRGDERSPHPRGEARARSPPGRTRRGRPPPGRRRTGARPGRGERPERPAKGTAPRADHRTVIVAAAVGAHPATGRRPRVLVAPLADARRPTISGRSEARAAAGALEIYLRPGRQGAGPPDGRRPAPISTTPSSASTGTATSPPPGSGASVRRRAGRPDGRGWCRSSRASEELLRRSITRRTRASERGLPDGSPGWRCSTGRASRRPRAARCSTWT